MFPEYLAVGKTATGKTKTLWEIRGGEPQPSLVHISVKYDVRFFTKYEGWNFNSGNYLFTTDTK